MQLIDPPNADKWKAIEQYKRRNGSYEEECKLIADAFLASTGQKFGCFIDMRHPKMKGRRPYGHRGTHTLNVDFLCSSTEMTEQREEMIRSGFHGFC